MGIGVFVGALERVAPQIEHFGYSQFNEWFEPAQQLFGARFRKDNLPVAHPNCQDVTVIADVEKGFPRTLIRLAAEIGNQIESV